MKVRVLPDIVINKISAGEVIDRPASVVRELVDNALDANASDISVYLEQGGHSNIRVVDNGCGMERDDAILAFERHATSKIKSENDLNGISTFGFRGEALPSIAAVAKVRLKTKTPNSSLGNEVLIEGGKLKGVQEISAAQGTDVSVQHIFFNTPARRKFLKSEKSEESRVKTWLQQSSIANPRVRYRLFLNGKEIINLAPRSTPTERASAVFKGPALSFSRSVPVHMEANSGLADGLIEIEGLISHPSLAQREAASFVLLVNNRLISDRALLRAVKDGFDSTLKEREYPVGFLALKIPPSLVDVNVHPQKSEVRFWDQRVLFGLIRDLIFQTVRNFKAPKETLVEIQPRMEASPRMSNVYEKVEAETLAPQPLFGEAFETEGRPVVQIKLSELRYIGQLFDCYLLCESAESFVVVDMHAAHERYNFNLIRDAVLSKGVNSQAFLIPHTVELTEEGLMRLLDQDDLLHRFGFEVEAFGEQTLIMRAAPDILDISGAELVIKELAAAEIEDEGLGRIKERIDEISARIACHASVRAGMKLTREEVYALFEALDSTEFGLACPHGRPVVAAFSRAAIEKWFGRDR